MSGGTFRIFVYGTLKRSQPNEWLMQQLAGKVQFLGAGRTVEKFPLIVATVANVPFLLHLPGKGDRVEGEVYDVTEEALERLDTFEDYPAVYSRENISVELYNKDVFDAWAYVYKEMGPKTAESPHIKCYDHHEMRAKGKPYDEVCDRDSSLEELARELRE